jgi:hypothetical protein
VINKQPYAIGAFKKYLSSLPLQNPLMLRRDIFNLLFTANRLAQPDMDTPDPVVLTPEYLLTQDTFHYMQEWHNPEGSVLLRPSFLSAFAFAISFSTSAATAMLTTGVQEAEPTDVSSISFGIKEGALFISSLTDDRTTENDKILAGLLLILTVKPQPGNRSYAKLQLLDHSGLTLSVLKTSAYELSRWDGAIRSSGAITSINITGRKAAGQAKPIIT